MKKNKEIKVGDCIWLYVSHLGREQSCRVLKVKKTGTLVTVVIECTYYTTKSPYEVTLYGHSSSSVLSGFDRYWSNDDTYYTCEFGLIERKTKDYYTRKRYIDVGRTVLELVDYLK